MSLILKRNVATGIVWVSIPEADLYLCCGCPADTVKHLRKAGLINTINSTGTEDGPNAVLLSDTLIQNGQVSNLTEFPILQMLYLQGMNLPNHPNYQNNQPILIGNEEQINAQLDYATIGNHGLSSIEEIMEAGISLKNAEKIFATKLHYSNGALTYMKDIVSSVKLDDDHAEIKNSVFITRIDINVFQIKYKGEQVEVDLNINPNEHYRPPYQLPFREIKPEYFTIVHTGEGNGWDQHRPCMASVIFFKDKTYLIDAGPNILNNLSYLGIGLSEIDGIFLSHIHDDHFAGITELLNVEKKLNLYLTKVVLKTAEKKLKALLMSDYNLLNVAFNCIELEFNEWRNIEGLEVKPVYSPHTVETSIFNFRVLTDNNYKTYTHLSDTINLSEFKVIIDESPNIFSSADFSSVKNNYLTKVDLKKIDVGGGLIHGHLSDYIDDESKLLVAAHTTKFIESESENIVNVNFGDAHNLIEDSEYNLLKKKALKFLELYFSTLEANDLDLLASQQIKKAAPGEKIISKDNNSNKIILILCGLVEFESKNGDKHYIDTGNFIGYSLRYFRYDLPAKYEAWSNVKYIEYDDQFINKFIREFSLVNEFIDRIHIAKILRNSCLIEGSVNNAVLYEISKFSTVKVIEEGEFNEKDLPENLFIISEGEVEIRFENKSKLNIFPNEHFGGTELLKGYRRKQSYECKGKVEVLSIPVESIENVPQLMWRLIEIEKIRYQLSIFRAK